MPSHRFANEIRKILEDDFPQLERSTFGHRGKRLSQEQKTTLRVWKEYYEIHPSPRGGMIRPASVYNSLQCLRDLGLFLGKPFEDASQQDLVRYVINCEPLADATVAMRKAVLRRFYRWILKIRDQKAIPQILDHPALLPVKIKPSKHRTPENFLTAEELKRMLCSTPRLRDRVVIMLTCGEGSMRAGEVASLNVGSVELCEGYCRLWIRESKSKERPVLLVDTFPYMRDYLNHEHELKNSKDCPLFYAVGGPTSLRRIDSRAMTTILKRAAARAGIDKKIFAHMGRHQCITEWARLGMNLVLNAKRAGITTKTLENVYLHYENSDVESESLRLRGNEDVRAERERSIAMRPLAAKKCNACGYISGAVALACVCGKPLDEDNSVEMEHRRVENIHDALQDDKSEIAKVLKDEQLLGQLAKMGSIVDSRISGEPPS